MLDEIGFSLTYPAVIRLTMTIYSLLLCLATCLPTRGMTMTSERAAVPGPELHTKVVIRVNYTRTTAALLDLNSMSPLPVGETISVTNSIQYKPHGPGLGPGEVGSIPGSSSGGLGAPSSAAGGGSPLSSLTPRSFEPLVISGDLIHVVNSPPTGEANGYYRHDACSTILNPSNQRWIALVRDGGCKREVKINNVFDRNELAAAVLIYGVEGDRSGEDSNVLNHLFKPGSTRRVAIWIAWRKIRNVVTRCFNSSGDIRSEDFPVGHQPTPRHWRALCNATVQVISSSEDNFLNKTSVLFVSISFILLMIISLAWLVFYYVQRFRYIHTKEQISRQLAHLAKKAVAKIPIKTLKQGDKETDPECDQCAICIEPYKPSDNVRILPCRHYFHKSCIDPWLLEQRSCPMCKLDILRAYGLQAGEAGSLLSEEASDSVGAVAGEPGSGDFVHSFPLPSSSVSAHPPVPGNDSSRHNRRRRQQNRRRHRSRRPYCITGTHEGDDDDEYEENDVDTATAGEVGVASIERHQRRSLRRASSEASDSAAAMVTITRAQLEEHRISHPLPLPLVGQPLRYWSIRSRPSNHAATGTTDRLSRSQSAAPLVLYAAGNREGNLRPAHSTTLLPQIS